MSVLEARDPADCRYDIVALGEVMLRLDPGERRIRTARTFDVWEGGGEYNVARGLRRCFGLRAAVVTALADNEVGHLVEDFMLTGGVDTSLVRWRPYDGIGRTVRNGLNFTERGFGVRAATGVSDRGHTAAAAMRPGEIDWDYLFGELGVRWLHTGGIFAGLSETTAEVVLEATAAARRHGTRISYDLNYRPSLWQDTGGPARAQQVNRALAEHVDVLIGNTGHFATCLGLPVPQNPDAPRTEEADLFAGIVTDITTAYPNVEVITATRRSERSASIHDWGAIGWHKNGLARATHRENLAIHDRVGGGDSFASGLIFGLLERDDLAAALELAAAHGALAMTTPGDTSMATLAEVEALAAGEAMRVQR